ncbi:1-deoxy-D-xylulose-5-phosphate reductoisomerase [Alphaproteobacteria bacterium KMM 3653]|uniref:1-deoxy-D-xylulose 5-phosphate reductoisomerase n=1 Tax=Harenicola maris TaxID=2841044 RepID=A0AAP2CMZ9_9RHOB|nr:1-deoxy-D-xylulose-5-phosphate reductoisomerase [Harenicola maris]
MRAVTVLGSTGSIGENTLDLIGRDAGGYDVVALTGGRNIARLAEQAVTHNASVAVTAFPELYQDLKTRLSGTGIEVAAGPEAVLQAAERPADWVMSGIIGVAGLAPGLKALEQGKTLALANKESLVCAGPLLLGAARDHGATVLPVDSEHSAVFQALIGEDIAAVERIVITASGGAFRDWPLDRLAEATLEQASSHPNWEMGQRITIDSASMFNKAMEVIETKEFFSVAPDQIEVLVHPESLIHALVGFNDGALMAHVGPPDMRHAIGFALNWPERRTLPVERLDLAAIGTLNFAAPDARRWPALRLATWVMEHGGLAGAAFNGAKEQALDAFISKQIGFTQMAQIVEAALEAMEADNSLASTEIRLDNVTQADQTARERARAAIAALN